MAAVVALVPLVHLVEACQRPNDAGPWQWQAPDSKPNFPGLLTEIFKQQLN